MRYCATLLFVFCVNFLSAQEKHFIYVQSDNKQLFYLSVNGKMYSSTASGYAIVSKLDKGIYNLKIGFADTTIPEQTFECEIDRKDFGFNLKNFGEKGWGLFNLQTLGVVMAGNSGANNLAKANIAMPKKEPEPISFEKKKDTIPVVVIQNIPVVVASTKLESGNTNILNEDVDVNAASEVSKVAEISNPSGLHLSYTDKSNKKTDTIYVVIPASQPNAIVADSSTVPTSEIKLKSTASNPAFSCKAATEEDFLKLRKKMAGANSDEKMIDAAMKFYREKCFTTSQIRLLSTLFLSDEGRYKFFDASYQYAADAVNYGSLQKEFIDPYYLNRFKALLR